MPAGRAGHRTPRLRLTIRWPDLGRFKRWTAIRDGGARIPWFVVQGVLRYRVPVQLDIAKRTRTGDRLRGVSTCRVARRRVGLKGLRRPRVAGRTAFVLLLALLFQLAAITAYACPIDRMPVAAEMSDCSGMAEPDPELLCEKHCNPDRSTTSEARVASVPPAILPPLRFRFARSLAAESGPRLHGRVPLAQSDPPATLRFCSLLI